MSTKTVNTKKKAAAALKEPVDTKLSLLLAKKGLLQADVTGMIWEKYKVVFGKDRLSRMCSGRLNNVQVRSLILVADVLGVKVDDLVEKEAILDEVKALNK